MSGLLISDVVLTQAPARDEKTGLIGWVSCTVGGTLRVDGIALRRTLGGDSRLAFPCRKDRAGRKHYVVRPLDETTRIAIERQVLAALDGQGVA